MVLGHVCMSETEEVLLGSHSKHRRLGEVNHRWNAGGSTVAARIQEQERAGGMSRMR
jgi:hypothetical protein